MKKSIKVDKNNLGNASFDIEKRDLKITESMILDNTISLSVFADKYKNIKHQ